MIPTYVFGWPTGKETGDYLALDLGMSMFIWCYALFSSIKADLFIPVAPLLTRVSFNARSH